MNEIKIKYSKDSLKFLSKLDKKSVLRIRDAIVGLTHKPPLGDIKPMQGTMMAEKGCVSVLGGLYIGTKMKKPWKLYL